MADKEKGTYVCSYCGSDDVQSPASAVWNDRKQKWELLEMQDWPSDYCSNCQGDTSFDWVSYQDHRERVGSRKVVLLPDDIEEASSNGGGEPQVLELCGTKTYLTKPVTEDMAGSMLILRKVNKWQWEIVHDELAVAG
jgi:hypothetical protein